MLQLSWLSISGSFLLFLLLGVVLGFVCVGLGFCLLGWLSGFFNSGCMF